MPHFDLVQLIQAVGYIGVFFIVFAESGLFFGFFLPGDSLLFTAGFLASQGFLNILWLIPLLMFAAIAGDSTGYWMGRKFGGWLMKQPDSLFFKKKHLLKAQTFYEKNGGKALILARFIPAVRTFAPIVAGMAEMHYDTFLRYNVIGGSLWVLLMTLLGYFLGNLIPDVEKYLLPIVGAIVVISVLPAVLHMMNEKDEDTGEEKGFTPLFKVKLFFKKIFSRKS